MTEIKDNELLSDNDKSWLHEGKVQCPNCGAWVLPGDFQTDTELCLDCHYENGGDDD